MLRGRLGTRRTEQDLDGGVCVRAIPIFSPPFTEDKERALIGAAPKKLIVVSPDEEYIAKGPSKGNSTPCECVTEELISCIGRTLPIKIARSRLAVLPGGKERPDVRFMSRVFLRKGERLRHGIELIAESFGLATDEMVKEIRPGRKEERTFYEVDIVDEVLQKIGRTEKEKASLRLSFARMIAFDALVGANDRHPENWGIIQSAIHSEVPLRFAPIYDTARGLFWQHTERMLYEGTTSESERVTYIEDYAKKSRPLITSGNERDDHFDVIEWVMGKDQLRGAVREVIGSYNHDRIRSILHCQFGRLLSRFRLELIDSLMLFRYTKLRKIVGV